MALQTFRAGIYLPYAQGSSVGGAPAFANLLLDAASEKAAVIFHAPETGTITVLGYRTGTVTSGATLDVRLETISGADPSGTLKGTNTNGASVVANNDDNTWFEVTLTAGASVTKGDALALVVANPAASFGNLNISTVSGLGLSTRFPYASLFTSAWATNANLMCCLVKYSTGDVYPLLGQLPIETVTQTAVSTSSTPDERGSYFSLPFPCRVTGWWFLGSPSVSTSDYTIKLYDSDGSQELLSKDMSGAMVCTGSNSARLNGFFNSTATLLANTFYRITLLPTTTSTVNLAHVDVNSASLMDGFDMGQNWHSTERTNAGAWTETATKRTSIGIIIDQLDDGAGSGAGMIVHPGMSGGCRG